MSATTFAERHAPTARHTRTDRAARETEPETSSDHGYAVKVIAGALFVTAIVAVSAPLGWAILPVAFAVLLATTAAVLHATVRLLNETPEEG